MAAAARISRALGASLEVFHSFQPPPAYFVAASGLAEVDPGVLAMQSQREEEACREQLDRLGLAEDSAVSLRVGIGARHRMLALRAKDTDTDLLIVGAHEKSSLIELGSTAERILRSALCPVLVLHRPPSLPLGPVLVLSDLSSLSEPCLRRGLDLVCAINGGGEVEGEAFFVMTPGERQGTGLFSAEEMEQLAMRHLSEWAEQVRSSTRARLRPEVRIGEPREEILDEISKQDPALVIAATHGHSGFDRFLLGSTAEAVARRSSANVLIVPAQEAESPSVAQKLESPKESKELSEGTRRRVALAETLGPGTLPLP